MPKKAPSITNDFVELSHYVLKADVIRLLPLAFCHKHHVVALERKDDGRTHLITVGMLKPANEEILNMCSFMLKSPIKAVQLNRNEIHKALETGYFDNQADEASGHIIDLVTCDAKPPGPGSSAPDLVDHLLMDAIVHKASDIHIESYLADTDVRYRVDGIMRHAFTHITADNIGEIINRLKIMSSLDISEQSSPQDGRFRCTFTDKDLRSVVDFRLNILPGPTGKDAVIRVLDASTTAFELDELGLNDDLIELMLSLVHNPEGMILVSGPTGCGKTTTLYATLSKIKDTGKKIITAEDPIEFYVDKINQKQVSKHVNMAELSRSFLRHDPDIILVGEIRDEETAEAASRAAATGHLVLSTLHTADAIGGIQRLRGLGLEDDEIAQALLGIMAQRLMRKVCTFCKAEAQISEYQQRVLGDLLEGLQSYTGKGCPECNQTGYRGRIGIYELFFVNDDIQRLVYEGANLSEIKDKAISLGFKNMLEDALDKVKLGITSVDEIFRVIPYRQLISTVKRYQ